MSMLLESSVARPAPVGVARLCAQDHVPGASGAIHGDGAWTQVGASAFRKLRPV
jgi:hypothetical protein